MRERAKKISLTTEGRSRHVLDGAQKLAQRVLRNQGRKKSLRGPRAAHTNRSREIPRKVQRPCSNRKVAEGIVGVPKLRYFAPFKPAKSFGRVHQHGRA